MCQKCREVAANEGYACDDEIPCLVQQISGEVQKQLQAVVSEAVGKMADTISPLVKEVISGIDIRSQIEDVCNQNLNVILGQMTIKAIKETTIQKVLSFIKEEGLLGKIRETAREMVEAQMDLFPPEEETMGVDEALILSFDRVIRKARDDGNNIRDRLGEDKYALYNALCHYLSVLKVQYCALCGVREEEVKAWGSLILTAPEIREL